MMAPVVAFAIPKSTTFVTPEKEIVWDFYSPFVGQGPHHLGKRIHRATLDILEQCGVQIGNRRMLEFLAEKGLPVETPDLTERRALIMDHFSLLSDFMGEHKAAFPMRGILLRYTKGLPHSSRFREKITKIKDSESLISVLDEYFALLRGLES